MKLKFGIGLAAVLFTSLAFGAGDAFTFKSSQKEGDVLKYKQVAKLDFQGMPIEFSASSTRKVIKIDASGNVTVKEDVSDAKLNGADAPEGSGPGATTVTSTAKGEVVKIEGDRVDENAYRMANLELFIAPDKPVNAGDTWSYDIKENKTTGAVNAKANYTFVGDEKIGDIDAVKVKIAVKESGDSGASTEGFIWLRKSDCVMVKMTSKWNNVPIGPGGISGDVTVTLAQ